MVDLTSSVIDTIEELNDRLQKVNAKAHSNEKRWSNQYDRFRETACTYDGDEDSPDTYDEDADGIEGCNRSEELTRLSDLKDEIHGTSEDLDEFKEKVENGTVSIREAEQTLDQLENEVSDLETNELISE